MTDDIPADRPGLPAPDSVVGVDKFVSPQNDEYTILHTTETDAYDETPPKPAPKPKKARRPRKRDA